MLLSARAQHILQWFLAVALGCGGVMMPYNLASQGTEHVGVVVEAEQEDLRIDTRSPTTAHTPIGLALEVENGVGKLVKVRAGQTFFIDQIDLRTFVNAAVDEGIDALTTTGAFASLQWQGLELEEADFVGLPNPDGTFTRRAYYRNAKWMRQQSAFTISQLDSRGHPTAAPIAVDIGKDMNRQGSDDFFVRRLRGIQWTFDCIAVDDCTGATQFMEEALVEVRNARHSHQANRFRIEPHTAQFELRWSLQDTQPYYIPVEQVPSPTYDYNFNIAIEPVTLPGPAGYYAPGTNVTVRVTLTDGSGNRLHPPGSLPTYNAVNFGLNEAGLSYYRAFFDPTTTYYRRKHRERMMMIQLLGPVQQSQSVRTIAELAQFLGPDDTQIVATPMVDGVYAEAQTFPPAHQLFGGAFFPELGGWDALVSDLVTFHIPSDAAAGTYQITMKSRRVYLGQDIPRTSTVAIQVGQVHQTHPTLNTGPCSSCHRGGGHLGLVLHANSNRSACAGCHVPLAFELEGPIYVRTHFIHSRSNRFDEKLTQCSSCHLTLEGIQRTSKSACLSCHQSYPESHVQWFGPVTNMYIGGGRESFQQCTDACHTNHKHSGLRKR
jgi:hypothetical protein